MNFLLTLLDIALTPALWVVLIFWWVWRHFNAAYRISIARVFDKTIAKPGQLFADGNSATSKTETKVRSALIRSGLLLAKQGTAIWTGEDHRGVPHKYTPDIIIPADKLIVEVDPEFTHGGAAKIADDLLRNQMYADLGYRIVRLRMGGAKPLSKNDVVVASSDYTDDITLSLVTACKRAKWFPSNVWESERIRYETQADKEKYEKSLAAEANQMVRNRFRAV